MRIKDFDGKSHKDLKIVIYGTTVGGKVIYQCLQSMGIKVEFFCDRGKKHSEFCGCPVKEPSVLCENRSYMVLVALTRSFDSVCQYMEQIQYEEVYSCINLVNNSRIEEFVYDENERTLVVDFLEKYPYYAGSAREGIVLPSLEVFITERCTLRCRDCSHLIPKYQKPRDYDTEEIIRNLENTLQVVEKVSDLNFLGGEPLLQKDLGRMLEWGYEQKRIGALTIISNGTVMPDEKLLAILKETGARLRLSNYGGYSTKLKEIHSMCKVRGISCYISDISWTDLGGIYDRHYKKEELKEIFMDCPYSYCMLLLKGRLYRCAHIAHLNNLQIIDSCLHDSVDMSEITIKNIDDKKRELREYLKIDYLQGCNYCNGIKNSIPEIEPGIQIER